MQQKADGLLRLCVVQLDVIPQARRYSLWEPAEPRLATFVPGAGAQDRRKLSVASLANESDEPGIYQGVLDIADSAMTARLEEVLDYVVRHDADITVLPEYAVPVSCLEVLLRHSAGRAIVAGLGRIRNPEDAATLRAAGATLAVGELAERNVSVLINDGKILRAITKREKAGGEDLVPGTGPVVVPLRIGTREVQLGVAVCMDFLRGQEQLRQSGAGIVCIPAYTPQVSPFRDGAPRDYVRLFANCAQYGGSTIMASGLAASPLVDDVSVRELGKGYDGVTLIEFERNLERPSPLKTPQNRLVLRSEIMEGDSRSHTLLGRLTAVLDRHEGGIGEAVALLCQDASRLSTVPGPLTDGLAELRLSSQQRVDDGSLITVARTHLVVATGNRPADVRERQASFVWSQLTMLLRRDPERRLGAALDLYRPASATPAVIFDRNDYAERVLKQVAHGSALPPVTERYSLAEEHLALPDTEIIGLVEQVVALWRRQADDGVPRFAEVCERFLAADEKLRHDARYRDASWWRAQIGAVLPAAPNLTPPPPAPTPPPVRKVPPEPQPEPQPELEPQPEPEAEAEMQADDVRDPGVEVGLVPPVTSPQALRDGTNVKVTWHWPDDLRLARVVWRAGAGENSREVTLSEYQHDGCVYIQSGEATEVLISALVHRDSEVLASAPAVTSVPAQAPTLSYHVRRPTPAQAYRTRPRRLHDPHWWCALRRVTLVADLPCTGLTVEVYVRGGDEEVLVHTVTGITVGPGGERAVTFELRGISRLSPPRFLSCRAHTASGQVRVDNHNSTGREIRPCFV